MTENIQAAETKAKTKTTRRRIHRKLTEKEEIISAIFMASEMALQFEDREMPDIADYIFKIMALTKYGTFFNKPCIKFIVDKAQQFTHSVRVKNNA